MGDKLDFKTNFASISALPATIRTENGEEEILVEIRVSSSREHSIFTVIEGERIYSNWIGGIVVENPSVIWLRIERAIHILSNGKRTPAVLSETMKKVEYEQGTVAESAESQFRLQFDGKEFVSDYNPTLTDALFDIYDLAEPEFDIRLQTCYHCRYANHASLLNNDREYRCYRDVPDAYDEIRLKGKQASNDARFAGTYTVNAFHTCAAWEVREV